MRQQPPFLTIAPKSLSPIVLTCEHATNRLPFRGRVDPTERDVLKMHWGWDIGAWAVTRRLASLLKASAIGGRWSRLWIDLNRAVDQETLIRRVAEGVELSWNRELTADEIERRLVDCHAPYHLAIDRLILRRVVRGVRPLIFSVHSFTPRYRGRDREFDVGMLYEFHGKLARRIGRSLGDAGLDVRYNRPYSGMAGMMYSVDRHGSHHRLPCLELELNQGLFARRGADVRLGRIVAEALGPLLG